MTRVAVTGMGGLRFGVEVADGGGSTSHVVMVPRALLDAVALSEEDAERLVRASFGFLLEREPPTQILREFSLDEIGRYFPEYRTEIEARLTA